MKIFILDQVENSVLTSVSIYSMKINFLHQPPGSAPPPPPPNRVSSRHSGKYGITYYGTLPSKLNHSSSDTYGSNAFRAKSVDLTYLEEDYHGTYSRSQSLECSACVREVQAECRECEETLYQQSMENCRECVEYEQAKVEEEEYWEKEKNVSCFACAPKTKKFPNESKTKRASKRKEIGKQKMNSIDETSA